MRCAQDRGIFAISARVHFFADADFDRILGIHPPENVTLTDGRDLESYAFLDGNCLNKLCTCSFGTEEAVTIIVAGCVAKLGHVLSAVRIASLRNSWKLPVQTTLCKGGLKKFVREKRGAAEMDIDKLLRSLLQNASISLGRLEEIKREVLEEAKRCRAYAREEIIHGKDFTHILAWFFEVDREQVERLLFSCMNYGVIGDCTAISRVARWVRSKAGVVSEAH